MTVCVQRGCGTVLNRKTAVITRCGPMCKKHADRVPPHVRRIGQLSDAQREALARLGRTIQISAAISAADNTRRTP